MKPPFAKEIKFPGYIISVTCSRDLEVVVFIINTKTRMCNSFRIQLP